MCWGFDCGDGWFDIIDTLCSLIQNDVDNTIRSQQYEITKGLISPENVVPEEDLQVVATQVKEKFGGLRFYVTGANDRVRGMIDMAEAMSYQTCDVCGNPGKAVNDGWVVTLCEPHRAERQKARTENGSGA
jgi:hypothetical protein